MSIDRGGLNYPIDVSYDPTGINQFRAEIAKTKQDWLDLKNTLSKPGSTPFNPIPTPTPNTPNTPQNPLRPPPLEDKRTWIEYFTSISNAGDSLIATFERLFVRVAIIGAIRQVGIEFKNIVGEMISVNAELETTTNGISGLLLALGRIKDGQGNAISQTEQFTLAQTEARKQINFLKVDALETATTFQQLAKAFEGAIGPGLQAGLGLDQIRKFTVEISKAATALGVGQEQLNTQIRQILNGSVSNRTIIPTALGITNADISRAKELGTLFEYLSGKLDSFNVSGKASLETFTVILTNVKDAVAQVLGAGGQGFFKQLEESLSKLQKAFVTNDGQGLILNPKVVFIVQQLGDFLRDAVKEVENLVTAFGFNGLLGAMQGFVALLRTGFQILIGSASGLTIAVNFIVKGFLALKGVLESVFGKSIGVEDLVAGLTALYVILFAISSTIGLLGNPVTLIAAGLLLVLNSAREFAGFLLDIQNLSFDSLIQILTASISEMVKLSYAGLEVILTNLIAISNIIGKYISGVFNYLGEQIQITLLGIAKDVAKYIPGTGLLIYSLGIVIDNYTQKSIKNQEARSASIKKEMEGLIGYSQVIDMYANAGDRLNEVIQSTKSTNGSSNTSFAQTIITKLFGGDGGGFPEKTSLDTAKAAFDDFFGPLPLLMQPTLQSMHELEKTLFDLKEKAYEANKAFNDGASILGIGNVVANERKNIFAAELEIHKATKKNLEDQVTADKELVGLKQRQHDLENSGPLNFVSTAADIRESLEIPGKIKNKEAEIAELKNDQLKIEKAILPILDSKNSLLAIQENYLLRQSNILDKIKADNDRAVFNTRFSTTSVTDLVTAQGALALLQAQQAQAREQEQRTIQNQKDLVDSINDNPDAKARAAELLLSLQTQSNAKEAERLVLFDKATEKAKDFNDQINKPLSTGFVDGVRKAIQGLPSLYQGIVSTIKNIVTGLTDFISTSIVDAFDPTKKADLQTRFAQFLQGIAKQVIDMFIHLALVQAALNLGFLGLGGVPGGGLPGGGGFFGGLLGSGASAPAPSTGIGTTVRDAATRITNVFNNPLQNIGALNSIGPRSFAPVRTGAVASAYQTRNTPTQAAPASAGGFVQAVVVPSEAHFAMQLAQGKNAMFNHMRDNAGRLRTALGIKSV